MSRLIVCVIACGLGCDRPAGREDPVVADAGPPIECMADAGTGAGSGQCSGSGSGGGSGSGSGSPTDPQACADCLIAHVAIAPVCGSADPDQLEAAATACGAASYSALAGSLACARALAWATVHSAAVVDHALAVDSRCAAGLAQTRQAGCLAATARLAAAAGFARAVADLVRDCPALLDRACVLARDVRDKLRLASAAVLAFGAALPAAIAGQRVVDWTATAALDPAAAGVLGMRYPSAAVGAALDSVAQELQAGGATLDSSLMMSCL